MRIIPEIIPEMVQCVAHTMAQITPTCFVWC